MSLDNIPGDDFGQVTTSPDPDAHEAALVPIAATAPVERLIAMALQHGAAVEAMERLYALDERWRADAARKAFFEALSAFQADCPVISKDKQARNRDGSTRYRYAALEDIMQAISPVLRRHGLSVRFDAAFEANPPGQVVTCIINHRDGHSERSDFRTPMDGGAPGMSLMQVSASAVTYGRRYSLLNALGIVAGGEDDDGAGGSGRAIPPRPAAVPVGDGVRDQQYAPQSSAPPPVARGRNVVRIPRPAQEPQGSDGPPSRVVPTSQDDTPVAGTPAAPERDANDEAKAELRMGLIKDWAKLLRATGKFDGLDDDALWAKATDVLSAQCEMQFKRPLHEMNVNALKDARRITDETMEKKGVAA